jgi:hypothetical protein
VKELFKLLLCTTYQNIKCINFYPLSFKQYFITTTILIDKLVALLRRHGRGAVQRLQGTTGVPPWWRCRSTFPRVRAAVACVGGFVGAA